MSSSFQYPFAFTFQDELTFGNFVAGASNAELLEFLPRFERGSVPFCYLWGRTGSGKTHLLQALSHASDTAVYLPLQQLQAYDASCLDGLEACDFLVFDDVQVVAGKRDWEEKLFYLFNAQQALGGKICMSASAAPLALPLQLADLKSRLQLALVYEVKPLDETDKQTALIQRAALRGIELKAEVATYLLSRSPRGMQELLAVLARLDTLSLAEKRRITIPFVKDIFHW
jgi:DnaA family protein